MKAKYLLLIGLFAATMVACSRDEESLFDKPAAVRAQEAIDNACDVLTTAENGWEMAYFPNLETYVANSKTSSKGYNMVLKFNKNGNVSVTAKNNTTTSNKIMTDTASTWAVKSDCGPILTFDTYNDVFHAFSDPGNDGAGMLGDYEFLILKATPELVLLKGKKHSAYSVMRPMKTTDLAAYYAACEKMQKMLFGNNNIVTLNHDNQKMYLYNGSEGQFLSAAYGSPLVAETTTYHPVCTTADGVIVSVGFGDDKHDHIFYYDSIKGELKSEKGAVMNAGNLNTLFGAYFTDNAFGWAVDPASIAAVPTFLDQVNTIAKDTKKQSNIKLIGYGFKQSLNMYEGGNFVTVQFAYKKDGKGKEQTVKASWTVNLTIDENGIVVSDIVPFDDNTNRWIMNAPAIQEIADALIGSFCAQPSEANLFNAAMGMYLEGEKTLMVSGSTKVQM